MGNGEFLTSPSPPPPHFLFFENKEFDLGPILTLTDTITKTFAVGVTPKAVTHRIARVRGMTAGGAGDDEKMSASPDKKASTPTKAKRGKGATTTTTPMTSTKGRKGGKKRACVEDDAAADDDDNNDEDHDGAGQGSPKSTKKVKVEN